MWVFTTEFMVSVPFSCFGILHSGQLLGGIPPKGVADGRGQSTGETQGTRRRIPGDTPRKYQIGGRAQGGCLWGAGGSGGFYVISPPYTYSYLSCMSSYNIYDANSFPATIWGITVVVHMICMYVTYQEGNADANDDFMEMKSIIWGFTIGQSGPL